MKKEEYPDCAVPGSAVFPLFFEYLYLKDEEFSRFTMHDLSQ